MGGIDFARNKMHEFKSTAIDSLNSFPESSSRDALIDLVEFTVSRNK